MNNSSSDLPGRIASLHLHSKESGEAFQQVSYFDLESEKGIVGNPRYFARRSRSGTFTKRQVSLIEREQISEHAVMLGLECIPPGIVRSNIETLGINLISLIGKMCGLVRLFCFFMKRERRVPRWMKSVPACAS